MAKSLPVRGAWIEMVYESCTGQRFRGRSPCGERGLKCFVWAAGKNCSRRSPCGERGLKCRLLLKLVQNTIVAPRAGSVD